MVKIIKKVLAITFVFLCIFTIFIVNISAAVPDPIIESQNIITPYASVQILNGIERIFYAPLYNSYYSNNNTEILDENSYFNSEESQMRVTQGLQGDTVVTNYFLESFNLGTTSGDVVIFDFGILNGSTSTGIKFADGIIATVTVDTVYLGTDAKIGTHHVEYELTDSYNPVIDINYVGFAQLSTTIRLLINSDTDLFDGSTLLCTTYYSQDNTNKVISTIENTVNSAWGQGYDSGYYIGFQQGANSVDSEINLFGWLADVINGITSIELFGPGFTIGTMFSVIFAVVIVKAILSFFAGG